MTRRLAALLCVLAAACGEDGPFTIVTIETRPAVHDIAEVVVTLSNDGTSLQDTFVVTTQTFPATFSISAPGRTGALGITVEAFDGDGLLVGRGSAETTVESEAASVLLDSADFVVNTEFLDDQFPSDDFESHGFQIAANEQGVWTVAYRDRCAQPCGMFARRFDGAGRPLESALAAGTNGFNVSTELTLGLATPAVASSGDATVVVWDFAEPSPGTADGIACRALDGAGAAVGDQVPVSIETLPDVVSVAALPGARFAVQWNGFDAQNIIKSTIVDARCQAQAPIVVSTALGTSGASRGSVAANGDRVMYAWIVDGEVRGRVLSATGQPLTADVPIVAKNANESVEFVRVAPLGAGFAVVVRWVQAMGTTGPGRIELYRTDVGAALQGPPTLVTTRSGTDFGSSESFGVASRPDGALMVVWHSCEANGDDSGCGVFGRVLRPSGVPVGDEFVLATTTIGNQSNPSVVGLPDAFAATWMDESQQAPDKSGSAVRARVLYPAYDDARGVLGAACNDDCEAGLVCGPSSEGGSRCFASCDPAGPPPLCPGGGACTLIGSASACLF